MFRGKRIFLSVQSGYYIVTGLWPLLHVYSFMLVTGFKNDIWLVKMVAMLSLAIGIALLEQATSPKPKLLLSMATAISFLSIDLYYALQNVIDEIYLYDAGLQFIFLVLAIYFALKRP